MDWYISKSTVNNNLSHNIDFRISKDVSLDIFIDGYILPRLAIYEEYKHLNNIDLILKLYEKYNLDFIKYVKGVFVIILKISDNYYVFNDTHSLKKFFIYTYGNEFVVSNCMKYITDNKSISFSHTNAVMYCLLEHFVDGRTMFSEVAYSKPATKLEITSDGKLNTSYYWTPFQLISTEIKDMSFQDIADKWNSVIDAYVSYLKPKDLTLTLTGGNDSRMVLAGLLANKKLPNTFTFGNPLSHDGIIAKMIADKINLNYNNYFKDTPTAEWFKKCTNKIIRTGNSLINLHRAHRLDAIEREREINSNAEMIFGGFMGGDYTKGIIYDDYITARLLRLWKYSELNPIDKIKNLKQSTLINAPDVDSSELLLIISNLPYFDQQYEDRQREFLYLFYVTGSVHDWQDSFIFSTQIKYIVNPFMDIDFLELLFSSKYSMLFKNNADDYFLKKLFYPELAVNITNILAPNLSDIPYAKRGYYSNNDFLGNKILYTLKRLIRYKDKIRYPQNFPYTDWMKNYVKTELEDLHPSIGSIFSVNRLKEIFNSSEHLPTEGYWHKFTNPINLSLNLKEFIS